jgi:hypothetical protein
MGEEDNVSQAEDLELEGAEGEAAVGGYVPLDSADRRLYDYETEFARLTKEGFKQASCTTEGSLMVKGNERVMLRF